MADEVRAHPWERTPLGPINSWPGELVTAVNLMLTSKLISCVVWGPEKILIYNDLYKPLLGTKAATLGGRFLEVWAEISEQAKALLSEPLKAEEANIVEKVPFLISINGEWVEKICTLTNNPVWCQIEQGAYVGGICQTVIDHSKQVQAEADLRESAARLRRIFESIGEAVIVTDQDTRIVQMNPVAEELTGWFAEEAHGQPLNKVFHIVHERTRRTLETPADRAKRFGKVAGLTKHAVLLGRSGRETHIDDSGAPIWDDMGVLSGIVLVFRNIDQRREAEREREQLLRELERGYTEIKAIYETSSIALAMIDPVTFHYLRGNSKLAEILNQPIEQIIGTPVFDLANDVGGLRDALMQAAKGTPVIGKIIEGELANSPGILRCWQAEYLPVFSPTGAVDLIVAASIEITEQRQLQAALIQNEKLAAVGRVAASITHEINNPLEAVTNLLYLARLSEDVQEIQGYLETAERELRRVSVISNQTLQFHRHATNAAPALFSELIESTLSIYQGRIVNAQVVVEQRLRSHDPIACFDGEIRQVLNNLVGNALDAMAARGGRLMIRSREATDWKTGRPGIMLTVADTGAGMNPRTRKKIFDPFFTTKGLGGSGLGLWISCEIINRHHGSLRVRSSQRQSSHGTVFTIFLPA